MNHNMTHSEPIAEMEIDLKKAANHIVISLTGSLDIYTSLDFQRKGRQPGHCLAEG
jgi:hypothetical protein